MPQVISIRLDKAKLLELEKAVPGRAGQVIQKIAQDSERHIKESFSAQSPSAPGSEPGVDTGALKNSIIAEPVSAHEWSLHDGVEYGIFLEFGTVKMAPRPFFRSGIETVVNNVPDSLIESVVK